MNGSRIKHIKSDHEASNRRRNVENLIRSGGVSGWWHRPEQMTEKTERSREENPWWEVDLVNEGSRSSIGIRLESIKERTKITVQCVVSMW